VEPSPSETSVASPASKQGKPRICILADFRNWAFDISARQILRELESEFDIVIQYVVDKPRVSREDYDLLHVCFWGETIYKAFGFDREQIIKEVSSHRWQDNPIYGPCTPEEFAQRYLSDCDTVICTSRRLTEIVNKLFPRTFHTPNGVDISRFAPGGRVRNSTLVFGWAGNFNDAVKGFSEFVVPACGERFELISAKGELNHQQMAEFYRKIDIFVVASAHEGEPLTLLEAMASGCFPVCVDVGVVPEMIKHKENGYIVPERLVEAFREGFEWCDCNRDRVRAAGLANAQLIAQERRWDICAQKFGHVYKETLARVNRAMFRNDDVSWDTDLENFRLFCAVFQKYGQTQIHGITLHGCTNVLHVHNGAEAEYEGFDNVAQLDNATIKQLSVGKAIEDRADIIEFLNGSADEVALHGLFHTDYSVMSEEEQDRDIGEGLTKMQRLFPRKHIRFFIAPFNRTNPATYQVAARYGLKVCADQGVHLEEELNNLVIRPKQWYRYHHHRFYPDRFTYYQLSIEKLDAALRRNFNP
jgi:glycosyltransferase involved in cell wall biosynthesis